jgi:hypothetical protein
MRTRRDFLRFGTSGLAAAVAGDTVATAEISTAQNTRRFHGTKTVVPKAGALLVFKLRRPEAQTERAPAVWGPFLREAIP